MTKQLKQEIDAIVQQLITNYKPEKIILFGSAARGDMGPDSDLDFFVIKQTSLRYHDRISDAREHVKTTSALDMVVYTPQEFAKATEERRVFIRQILKYGKTLYENSIQSS